MSVIKSNLLQRTLTGLFLVVVLVGSIWYGPLSYGILFTLIIALSLTEFAHLINRSGTARINTIIIVVGGAYLFWAVMGVCSFITDARVFLPYLLLWFYLMISELYLRKENPLANWVYAAWSQLYVALPFALLNLLAFHLSVSNTKIYSPVLPLSLFIFIWLSDTGAYCFGSLLGRHRLFERISPKKTWEGSIGGALCSIASAFIFARVYPFLTLGEWVGFAGVVVLFGTWGDLTESLMKRRLGIKDSGNLLPGHGGMLDRFDSSLMAIPAAVVYLYLLSFFAF